MLKVSLIFLPDNVTFLVKMHKLFFEYYIQYNHSAIVSASLIWVINNP